jgi:alpha-galactosidase
MLRHTIVTFLALLTAGPVSATAATVAQTGDASIAHDLQAQTWSISAGGATLTLSLGPSRDFRVIGLATRSNIPWAVESKPDTLVTIDGTALAFGSRENGFVYENVLTSTHDQTLTLDAIFDSPKNGLRSTRHYRVTSGSPAFEVWTTYTPHGQKPVVLSDLNGFEITVPNGTVHWLTGLLADSSGIEQDTAFTLQQKQLALHEEFSLGAQGRSSERVVPWVAVDGVPGTDEEFFGALMWSGAWSLTGCRRGSNLTLSWRLAPMATTVSHEIEGPHALFGVVRGGLAQATGALRSYILDGIRGGRPLTPLVTYNTWFAYATSFDQSDIYEAMDFAAVLGAERFVIDAGWYAGAGSDGIWDFDSGLGSWDADPARFPDGLGAFTDYAHALGMQFGLWVEPERIDRTTVSESGVEESWLATTQGAYGSKRTGLICLANEAARTWLLNRLSALIDAVRPDYLKWDNNLWVNCDRTGHGHGAEDGNFAQVTGLYDVLSRLRARYPDLLLENVSGGGNRLDVGMMRYSDVAWMDDRTAPSVHVRHNVQGLSAVFPPAYLLSFVTDHPDEPLNGARDMSMYFRSRMEGALGLCFRVGSMASDDSTAMANEIEIYKGLRSTLGVASSALLTGQASRTDGPDWDVLQEATLDGHQMLLWAVQSNDGVDTITVRPTGLDATRSYEVRSIELGLLGTATGSELMTNGVELNASASSAAHILILTAR